MTENGRFPDYPLRARLPQVRLGNRYEKLETRGFADRKNSSLRLAISPIGLSQEPMSRKTVAAIIDMIRGRIRSHTSMMLAVIRQIFGGRPWKRNVRKTQVAAANS